MFVVVVSLVLMQLQTMVIWLERASEVLVYHRIDLVLWHKVVVKNVLTLLLILL